MLIPVRCYSCGRVLADKWTYFEKKRAEKLAKAKAESVVHGTDAEVRDVAMGDVLDKLGLTLYCCRAAMMTNVSLMDVI